MKREELEKLLLCIAEEYAKWLEYMAEKYKLDEDEE